MQALPLTLQGGLADPGLDREPGVVGALQAITHDYVTGVVAQVAQPRSRDREPEANRSVAQWIQTEFGRFGLVTELHGLYANVVARHARGRPPRALMAGARWRLKKRHSRTGLVALAIGTLFSVACDEAMACSVSRMADAVEITLQAQAIVRARVEGYTELPTHRDGLGQIQFEALEVLKGPYESAVVQLCGRLDRYDGPNDGPVPYDFVRPGGRHGTCYATDYRTGAESLLFLRAHGREARDWSASWAPLAATNEEVGGSNDPWVLWVRPRSGTSGSVQPPSPAGGRRRHLRAARHLFWSGE